MHRSASLPARDIPFQFTIRSLCWLMVSVGMVLAFVRPAEWVLRIAVEVGIAGAGLGCIAGWPARRMFDGVYWSLLTLALATICLAGQKHVAIHQALAWTVLAAIVGAMAGGFPPGHRWIKTPISAAAGTLGMVAILGRQLSLADLGDVGLALIVSSVMPLLADLFAWSRQRYGTSYGGLAAALIAAVILGNWGADILTPRLGAWLALWQ